MKTKIPNPSPWLFTGVCLAGMVITFVIPWLVTWAGCELHTFFHP